ncbi:MAG: acyl-ACP--UDP-N-acetylglucosamine O-acyltransferase [Candidatus Firestonebacteria bacterium]
MNEVHATALVHKNAKIGKDVTIGPYCIIGENVTLGDRCRLHSGVVINGNTTLGINNEIYSHAVIGNPGQDRNYKNEKTFVEIGDNNIIRESATINSATGEGQKTIVGNDCFIFALAHVGHNVKVGNKVTLVNGAGLAGFVEVEEKAFISAYCVVHQFCKVGSMAMIGLISPIEKDVPPFVLGTGNPFKVFMLNKVGLERNGVPENSKEALKKMFRIVFRSGLNTTQALTRVKEETGPDPYVAHFISFVEKSKRGIYK